MAAETVALTRGGRVAIVSRRAAAALAAAARQTATGEAAVMSLTVVEASELKQQRRQRAIERARTLTEERWRAHGAKGIRRNEVERGAEQHR